MAAQLVADALMMAIWRHGKPDALLHHSDQGSQYSSEQFQKLLTDHGVTCSSAGRATSGTTRRWKASSPRWRPSGRPARCIAPGTRPEPTCSTTSSGPTTRVDASRSSGISALGVPAGQGVGLSCMSTKPAAAHPASDGGTAPICILPQPPRPDLCNKVTYPVAHLVEHAVHSGRSQRTPEAGSSNRRRQPAALRVLLQTS